MKTNNINKSSRICTMIFLSLALFLTIMFTTSISAEADDADDVRGSGAAILNSLEVDSTGTGSSSAGGNGYVNAMSSPKT